jgi:hypothetical protein
MVMAKGMIPWAMPPIGFSIGVVIFPVMLEMRKWSGLGAQGV